MLHDQSADYPTSIMLFEVIVLLGYPLAFVQVLLKKPILIYAHENKNIKAIGDKCHS